jgi:hypothetical protein
LVRPGYWFALVFPPLAFSVILWGSALLRRRRASAGSRARDGAASKALRAISGADAGVIGLAMRTYLEDLTEASARGLRYDDVIALVSGIADVPTGRAFSAALEAAETARFAGDADSDALISGARVAIEHVEAMR